MTEIIIRPSHHPIATAPTPHGDPMQPGPHHVDLLLYPHADGGWCVGRWNGEGWYDHDGMAMQPTHWAPLPAEPG